MCSEYKQTLNDIVRKLYMFKFKFNQITKKLLTINFKNQIFMECYYKCSKNVTQFHNNLSHSNSHQVRSANLC